MANYYVPIVVGLFLSSTFCRLFTIIVIKEEQTLKAFFFLLMFATFCFLYLVSALALSDFWHRTGQTVLFLSLALGNLFEWRDFLVKMREKDEVYHHVENPETPTASTLGTMSETAAPVTLVATEKAAEVKAEDVNVAT